MGTLVPVDAKALAYDVLSTLMSDVNVGAMLEGDDLGDANLPHLGLDVTGGSRLDRVTDTAHVSIRSWADDEQVASNICRRAYAHLLDAPEHPLFERHVRRAESFGGPVYFPDPDSSTPRYQATVEWHLRGEPLEAA